MPLTEKDRFRGCLLGLACGDAVGTTAEFCPRGTFVPVTDMVGGGIFDLKPGEWTDDTSMALCLAASLVECQGFNPYDQMERYWKWVKEGYMSSNGRCFDVGNTVYQALEQFQLTGNPYSGSSDPWSAGNGCIMRLAPVPMFYYPNRELAVQMAGHSARTTHGAVECIEACYLLTSILFQALAGASKQMILHDHGITDLTSPKLQTLAQAEYLQLSEIEILGTGYVVESLEAALWCFAHTDSFEAAILKATNLGDDADTTAAVCGQVAGAYYGSSEIPSHWLQHLRMQNEITDLADQLWQHVEMSA